jgi:hypothetical protein
MKKQSPANFKKPFYCGHCNKTTEFEIHQFSAVKKHDDAFKNTAIAKCLVCGHSSSMLVFGQSKTITEKKQTRIIIDPSTATLGKVTHKKKKKKSLFETFLAKLGLGK